MIVSNMDKEEKNLISSIFNTKTIIQGGAVLIALTLVYFVGGMLTNQNKALTNELPHIQRAVEEQTKVMSEVLRENTKAIEGNTKVLEIIERRLK